MELDGIQRDEKDFLKSLRENIGERYDKLK